MRVLANILKILLIEKYIVQTLLPPFPLLSYKKLKVYIKIKSICNANKKKIFPTQTWRLESQVTIIYCYFLQLGMNNLCIFFT